MSYTIEEKQPKSGRAAFQLDIPKLDAGFTTVAKFFIRLSGAAATASRAAYVVTPVMTFRPNVPMVFVSTKKLEDRKRRDLVVHQDDGRLDPHKWALGQKLATSPCDRSGQRPRAGHTMLAALEVDDAVAKTNNARRTARDARMPAAIDVIAAAIRRCHDVGGSDLGTILRYNKVANQTAALVDHSSMHLRTRVGSLLRDTHASISDQPDGVRQDHRGGDDGVPKKHHTVAPTCPVGPTL